MGRAIKESKGCLIGESETGWIAYDLLFNLAEEQIGRKISVILDINLGWRFQWKKLDTIVEKNAGMNFLPILLEADRSTCMERIRERYSSDSTSYDPPALYKNNEKIEKVREFIEALDRPDIHRIDANLDFETVYEFVLELVKRDDGI